MLEESNVSEAVKMPSRVALTLLLRYKNSHCVSNHRIGEGSNCDNIKLHCFQSVNCPIVDTIIEQAVVSDLGEGSREQRCPTGSVISGIECSGRYCRTKTIFCKSITYVDASPWWMDDDDDEYCSTLLPLGRECTDPSACESGFCADDKCSSGQDGADCDGDEDCINGRCILNEVSCGVGSFFTVGLFELV